MGMELNKKRHGEKTETGMSEKQLEEFASGSMQGKPERAKHETPPEFDKWKRSKSDFDKPMEKPAAVPKEMKRGFMSDAHSGHGRHKRPRGG